MSAKRALNKTKWGQWDALAIASVVLLALSVVLGGASRNHALRLAVVELAALPLLVLAASRLIKTEAWREHRFALSLLAMIAAVPLIQLIPLPPSVWTALPGRDQMALALDLAGLQPGWSTLTLTPDLTWRAVLALIPPFAMLMAVLSAPPGLVARLVELCILAALCSVLLGAAQLASGSERLYPWETTSAGAIAGFFANRNHLASLLLVALPFTIILGAGSLRRRDANTLPLWFAAFFTGLVVVALAAIRSRTGMVLFVPVIMASLLAAWFASGRGRPAVALLGLVGVTGAALTVVLALALPPILARFGTQDTPELRFERWPIVAEAAQTYLPLGSGIGSFDSVYRSVEPLEQLDGSFFNQAHNDYLETWLEAGWLGAGLIMAFLLWYGRRTWTAWRAPPSRERHLQRAASIAIGVLILHSVGDYPLRTATLAVVLALCCGVLELASRPDRIPTRTRVAA